MTNITINGNRSAELLLNSFEFASRTWHWIYLKIHTFFQCHSSHNSIRLSGSGGASPQFLDCHKYQLRVVAFCCRRHRHVQQKAGIKKKSALSLFYQARSSTMRKIANAYTSLSLHILLPVLTAQTHCISLSFLLGWRLLFKIGVQQKGDMLSLETKRKRMHTYLLCSEIYCSGIFFIAHRALKID